MLLCRSAFTLRQAPSAAGLRRLSTRIQALPDPNLTSLPSPPMVAGNRHHNIMTLSRFMIEATRTNPDHADFEGTINSIQIACKAIANAVSRHGVNDLIGSSTTSDHDSLYDTATNILKSSLRFTGKLGVHTTEGENPVLIEEAWNSPYITVVDPLDGALNIDVGIATGTIFGIFKEKEECLVDFGEDVDSEAEKRLVRALQGPNLVAAGTFCFFTCRGCLPLVTRLMCLLPALVSLPTHPWCCRVLPVLVVDRDDVQHGRRRARVHHGPLHRRIRPHPPQRTRTHTHTATTYLTSWLCRSPHLGPSRAFYLDYM
jgi:hypothetical protein